MVQRFRLDNQFAYKEDFCHLRFDRMQNGFPTHAHDYVELIVVMNGRGRHTVDETVFDTVAGDVFVVQGNTTHSFEDVEDFWLCNVMFKDLSQLMGAERLHCLPGFQTLFVIEPAYSRYRSCLRLNDMQMREMLELLQKMQHEYASHVPGYESMIQAMLLQLIIHLSRAYEEGSQEEGRYLRLGKALAHMQASFRQDMSVDELAGKAGLSRRHFLRMFKQCTGTTPIDYVNQQRIRAAAKLLRERSNLSIGEVAEECGFSDSNYFTRRFTKAYGQSPRDYRRNLR